MVCPRIHFSFSLAMQLPYFFGSNSISKKNKIRTGEIVNYMLYNYRTNSLKTYGEFLRHGLQRQGQIHCLETFCKVLLGAQDLKITREDRRYVWCKNINLVQINGANSFEDRNLCHAGIKIQLGCSFSN